MHHAQLDSLTYLRSLTLQGGTEGKDNRAVTFTSTPRAVSAAAGTLDKACDFRLYPPNLIKYGESALVRVPCGSPIPSPLALDAALRA